MTKTKFLQMQEQYGKDNVYEDRRDITFFSWTRTRSTKSGVLICKTSTAAMSGRMV